MEIALKTAHVVCKQCETRWTVSYAEGNSPISPRECKNRECEAGWLDLPLFMDKVDADRCADELARERVAAMREL